MIDGKAYTAKQYVDSHCMFPKAEEDENCFKASKQANKDMSKPRKVDW